MPLYSNISDDTSNVPKNETAVKTTQKAAPSAGMKFLQDHLLSKKRSRQSTSQVQKLQKLSLNKSTTVSDSTIHRISGSDWNAADEYDPMIPNSYEILQLEHIRFKEARQNAIKNSISKIDPSILDVLDRLEDEESDYPGDVRSNRGTAIAPPSALQTSKLEVSIDDLTATKTNQPAPQLAEKLDGSSAAAKIMAKMGYKAGQGLGKDEQGMNAPLEVEKSGPSVGRIVQRTRTPPPVQSQETKLEGTRVLLLQNMVGPGEVDDDLEIETKMECTKYGEVVACLIYEIPNKLVPDEEAVRIFIEFKEVLSAIRAANDLNGRYFGGRVVRASFYDVDKFARYELGA